MAIGLKESIRSRLAVRVILAIVALLFVTGMACLLAAEIIAGLRSRTGMHRSRKAEVSVPADPSRNAALPGPAR